MMTEIFVREPGRFSHKFLPLPALFVPSDYSLYPIDRFIFH